MENKTRSEKGKGKGKKLLLFVILALIIALAAYFITSARKEAAADAEFAMSTNAERVEFLNKQGLIVKPEPAESEKVLIPSEFSDVYKDYAALQSSQGFDLEKYKGKEAELITYRVLNYPNCRDNVTANLLVADGRLIGADITIEGENGGMKPLIKSSSETTQAQQTSETSVSASTTSTTEKSE